MKISVIIPTYKPQSYVWECLDSLENQTFSKEDFEVIVVLNGCDEPYFSQLNAYIQRSSLNYRFIHTGEGGVSNARNLALDIAKGEYITFIDDDDYISPQYLTGLYSCVNTNTVAVCYPYFFKDGVPEQQLPYRMTEMYERYCQSPNKISSGVRSFFSGPCMKLIPRSVIANRHFDIRLKNGEDSLFMFLISDQIQNIVFANRDTIYYRRDRVGSAVNVHRTFGENIKSNLLQIGLYTKYYMRAPWKYNIYFWITRVGGALYAICTHPFK